MSGQLPGFMDQEMPLSLTSLAYSPTGPSVCLITAHRSPGTPRQS